MLQLWYFTSLGTADLPFVLSTGLQVVWGPVGSKKTPTSSSPPPRVIILTKQKLVKVSIYILFVNQFTEYFAVVVGTLRNV